MSDPNDPFGGVGFDEPRRMRETFLASIAQDSEPAAFDKASALVLDKRFTAALAAYEVLAEKFPSRRGDALSQRGAVQVVLGRYEEAVDTFVAARDAGFAASKIDDSLWEACEAAYRQTSNSRWVQRYADLCPGGKYAGRAQQLGAVLPVGTVPPRFGAAAEPPPPPPVTAGASVPFAAAFAAGLGRPPPATSTGSLPGRTAPDSMPTLAVILSVVGVCCFPLSLVGALLGYLSMQKAKREGRPVSPLSWASMGLTGLGLLVGAALFVVGMKAESERSGRVEALRKKLAGTLEGTALDEAAACDAARAYLWGVKASQEDTIDCKGPYQAGATTAKLAGVVERQPGAAPRTVCFAKAHRWFVTGTPKDGACEEAVEDPAKKPATEEEFLAREEALRGAIERRRAQRVVGAFEATLEKVREAIDAEEAPGARCPDLGVAKGGTLTVQRLDGQTLRGTKRDAAVFGFLDSGEARTAVDAKETPEHRAAAIEALGRYLVVFDADPADRAWPTVESDTKYTIGEFEGRLRVLDLDTGQALCQAPLAFENGAEVSTYRLTKLESKRGALEHAVRSDFEKAFDKAASAAVKKATGGQLSLGLTLLD